MYAVPAAAATSNLATYHFPQQRSGPAADWFQLAVRDIVKHVDTVPFLQLVQLGDVTPKFTNLAVPPSVVPVPEVGVAGLRPANLARWIGLSWIASVLRVTANGAVLRME